jgi:hypothetical protein
MVGASSPPVTTPSPQAERLNAALTSRGLLVVDSMSGTARTWAIPDSMKAGSYELGPDEDSLAFLLAIQNRCLRGLGAATGHLAAGVGAVEDVRK